MKSTPPESGILSRLILSCFCISTYPVSIDFVLLVSGLSHGKQQKNPLAYPSIRSLIFERFHKCLRPFIPVPVYYTTFL